MEVFGKSKLKSKNGNKNLGLCLTIYPSSNKVQLSMDLDSLMKVKKGDTVKLGEDKGKLYIVADGDKVEGFELRKMGTSYYGFSSRVFSERILKHFGIIKQVIESKSFRFDVTNEPIEFKGHKFYEITGIRKA